MQIKLSENIRRFRRERKMTQEQLAEAMDVSAGAVYKWETNQSTPDLRLILEMARLFQTSTDVLLGYEWQSTGPQAALDRIDLLSGAKRTEEACAEVERALKNYPNRFDIVYRGALAYLGLGEGAEQGAANRRAIELLEHACELMEQNRDEEISETSLRAQIADALLRLDEPKAALRILKRYNACGINDARIGMVLGDWLHDADGAEKYLARAFATFAEEIDDIMVGYANVFFQRGNYEAAADCLRWLRTVLRGIQPESELTRFDKYDCVLLEIIAECRCLQGESERARALLAEAVERARRYDRAAPEEIGNVKFYALLGIERLTACGHGFDRRGETAMEILRNRVRTEGEAVPGLRELWREVTREALPGSGA